MTFDIILITLWIPNLYGHPTFLLALPGIVLQPSKPHKLCQAWIQYHTSKTCFLPTEKPQSQQTETLTLCGYLLAQAAEEALCYFLE